MANVESSGYLPEAGLSQQKVIVLDLGVGIRWVIHVIITGAEREGARMERARSGVVIRPPSVCEEEDDKKKQQMGKSSTRPFLLAPTFFVLETSLLLLREGNSL